MNDDTAPERIWTQPDKRQGYCLTAVWSLKPSAQYGLTEYVRADLLEAAEAERDRLREVARWFIQYAEGAPVHRGEADEMLAKARAALSDDGEGQP